jgi:hypothetical protein
MSAVFHDQREQAARVRIAKLCKQRALDGKRDTAATLVARPEGPRTESGAAAAVEMLTQAGRTLRLTPDNTPSSEALAIEARHDRVELEGRDRIGEGGMGQVRLAEQVSLGREVAVKSLLPHRRSTAHIEALTREARIVGRLEHPNIVPIHALGWDDEHGPVLVMKRVEGEEWGDVLERERAAEGGVLSEHFLQRHLRILIEIANAIAFAHSRGVIHRDVKPGNVMLGPYGETYLLDWGVAFALEDGAPPSNQLVGTPSYMAPEMVEGAAVGATTDVYLLGATLHRILTGTNRNGGETMEEVLMSAWSAPPQAYPALVPAGLAAICNQACSRESTARYASADAFREAIEEFLRYRSASLALERAERDERVFLSLLDEPTSREQRVAVASRFNGARYGFEEARREWPENERARAGLARVIERMARYKLERGDLHAASVLLDEHEGELTELRGAVAEEEARRTQLGDAHATLAQLARANRLEGESWGRTLGMLISGVATALFMAFCGYMWRNEVIEVTPLGTLLVTVAAAGGNALSLRVFRRELEHSDTFKRLMTAFIMMLLLIAVSAALGEVLGIPFEHLQVTYLMVFVAVTFTLATVIDERVWMLAGLALVTAVLSATHLNWVFEIVASTYLLGSVYLAWVVAPRRGAPGRSGSGASGSGSGASGEGSEAARG